LGKAIEQVPKDMAAIIAIDWAATRAQSRDAYTDVNWWEVMNAMGRPWALHLTLVHGTPKADCRVRDTRQRRHYARTQQSDRSLLAGPTRVARADEGLLP
jgi:hypothetical protein